MQPHVITVLCNFLAILFSGYISIAIYQAVESIVDNAVVAHKSDEDTASDTYHFRGDRQDLRTTIYSRLDFFMYREEESEPEEIIKLFPVKKVHSPFQICYVNSYRVYDSNSTTFDYTKETEYDVEGMMANENGMDELFGLNKMYMVFDDIHMVFSVKHQQCIKYPDVYRNNEL